MNYVRELSKGVWAENPVFRLLLGMCPTLAVTTSVKNGLGMGVCTLAVLVGSNAVIALLRHVIPPKVRIPIFIIVIATFVTIVSMLLEAYANDLYKALGLFIPLIVVNCIILGRAEAFASSHGVFVSSLDGLGMGLGFTLALSVLAGVREILGNGTLMAGTPLEFLVFGKAYEPAIVMVLAPGAFLALGFLLAGMNKLDAMRQRS